MNAQSQALKQVKIEAPVHPKGLTPHIVLIASLLYMMSTDGDLAPEEISRLQESVGLDKEAIPKARAYIKKNKFDTFLSDSCDVLDKPSQVCILANVYECMLADGVVQKAETKLFQKIQKAYGFNDKTFLKISSVLDVKSNSALLGSYDSASAQKHLITPHLVLAASILYMMSADGDVSEEEIGQLSAVINPYEGLQAAAMSYVDKFKLNEFIAGTQNKLNAEQRLYILLNLCDSMLADGVADPREVAIFNQFLEVFGYTEHAFKPYYSVIYIKNVKPFEAHDSSVEDANGLFQNIINHEHGGFSVKGSASDPKNDQQMHERLIEDDEDGEKIRRTMQENTSNITDGFGGKENITKVANNALSASKQNLINQESPEVNLQKANAGAKEENVQKISDGPSGPNVQNISKDSSLENTQKIDSSAKLDNVQTLQVDKGDANIQSISQGSAQENQQSIDSVGSQTNVQNLTSTSSRDNVAKLDTSNTSPNVQTLGAQSNSTNVQTLADQASSDNVQTLTGQSSSTNIQSLEQSNGTQNRQGIASESLNENIQSLAKGENDLNKQKLGKDQSGNNNAKLSASSFEINVQSIGQKDNDTNTITLSSNASSLNNVELKSSSSSDNKVKTLQERIEDKKKGEENHVLSNLIKETEKSTAIERLKNLSGQLKSVNAKLNQVENINRELPVPMDAIESRLDEKLSQETNSSSAKIKSSNPPTNQASIPIDVFKDEFAHDRDAINAQENASEPFASNDASTVSFKPDALEDDFKGEPTDALSNKASGAFKDALEDDLRVGLKDVFNDQFMNDGQDDILDEVKSDFNDAIEDDFKGEVLTKLEDKFNKAIDNSLSSKISLNPQSVAQAQAYDTASLFDDLFQNQANASNVSSNPATQAIQNLSSLDGSLLALQIKGAKGNSVTQVSSAQKWKRSQFIYKTIKGTLVFALIFSWHFYTETACDMVSCSWSQIGSPVRLDLKPEVVPTSVLSTLKLARSSRPSGQV